MSTADDYAPCIADTLIQIKALLEHQPKPSERWVGFVLRNARGEYVSLLSDCRLYGKEATYATSIQGAMILTSRRLAVLMLGQFPGFESVALFEKGGL
jgi:hypothetical protein